MKTEHDTPTYQELIKFPIEYRFIAINSAIESVLATTKATPEDVSWTNVDEILHHKENEYDYEFLAHIHNHWDFLKEYKLFMNRRVLGTIWKEKICKECKQPFTISLSEVKFFERKKLHIPKRCPECRKKRKESGENESA